jgi:hypothetical protein
MCSLFAPGRASRKNQKEKREDEKGKEIAICKMKSDCFFLGH